MRFYPPLLWPLRLEGFWGVGSGISLLGSTFFFYILGIKYGKVDRKTQNSQVDRRYGRRIFLLTYPSHIHTVWRDMRPTILAVFYFILTFVNFSCRAVHPGMICMTSPASHSAKEAPVFCFTNPDCFVSWPTTGEFVIGGLDLALTKERCNVLEGLLVNPPWEMVLFCSSPLLRRRVLIHSSPLGKGSPSALPCRGLGCWWSLGHKENHPTVWKGCISDFETLGWSMGLEYILIVCGLSVSSRPHLVLLSMSIWERSVWDTKKKGRFGSLR